MNEILQTITTTIENAKAEQLLATAVPTAWIGVDYVCICSALSPIHLKAIYERVYSACKDERFFVQRIHKTSMKDPDWLYLIVSDSAIVVLIHMMLPEARLKYDIDTLVAEQA